MRTISNHPATLMHSHSLVSRKACSCRTTVLIDAMRKSDAGDQPQPVVILFRRACIVEESLHGEHEERRGETSYPWRIRQMGEKAPQRCQDDGWLPLLSILAERKVGPSRFPSAGYGIGWKTSLSSRRARIRLLSMGFRSAAFGLISAATNRAVRCRRATGNHVLPLWPPGLCVSRGSYDPPQHIHRCRRARYSPALDAMRPRKHLREYLSPQAQMPRQRIA